MIAWLFSFQQFKRKRKIIPNHSSSSDYLMRCDAIHIHKYNTFPQPPASYPEKRHRKIYWTVFIQVFYRVVLEWFDWWHWMYFTRMLSMTQTTTMKKFQWSISFRVNVWWIEITWWWISFYSFGCYLFIEAGWRER